MNPTSRSDSTATPTPAAPAPTPADPAKPATSGHPAAGQNKPAPASPRDGADNQGGIRRQGDDYLRDLGTEQDA